MKNALTLAAALAALASKPADVDRAIAMASRASSAAQVLAARDTEGKALTAARRDELLQKIKAGDHVEVDLDILAYEQRAGERNRNFVRFRDGLLVRLGASGKGKPFLRDHAQHDVLAIGGTITASRTEKRGEGDYAIHMTVRLSAPWAVELALRDLLNSVSIGWHSNERPHCSACGAAVFTKCYHWPGERLTEVDAEGGGKRKVRDANGTIVVEWIYQDGELVECSAVVVPAVPGAHIEGIRASLSASTPGLAAEDTDTDHQPQGGEMKNRAALIAILGLAATASDEEIEAAVKKQQTEAAADKAALTIVQGELGGVKTLIETLSADKKKRDEDAFILAALSSGRIGKAEEASFRALYQLDSVRATTLMAERKEGSATPVGLMRQSGGGDPTAPALHITGGLQVRQSLAQRRDAAIAQLKTNPQAAAWATILGVEPKGRFEVPQVLMAGTTISNDAELEPVRVGFNAAFLESVAGEPDPALMLATEVSSNKKEENYSWVGELPGMQEWKTDRMLKVLEAYGLAIKNKKWEASLRLKNDDIADDNLGLLPPLISDMAANARLHPGILVARLLLNGFDGTAFPDLGDGLAFDGEFFFSDNHATGDNKLAVVFSAANLDAAAQLLRKQKRFDADAKVGSLYAKGTHLFVGVADEQLAERVLTQEYLASGETNVNRNKYTLVVTPEFAAGEWMLADLRGGVRPVILQNREPLTTSTVGGRANNDSVGFMYDELWMGARARYNAGYFDFRRIVGSKP